MTKDGFERLLSLLLLNHHWDYGSVTPHLVDVLLGIEPKILGVLDEHSTNWPTGCYKRQGRRELEMEQ